MRVVQNIQMQLGEVDVSKIKFNLKSRDDIPRILRGLQHVYGTLALRAKIFELLIEKISPKVDKDNGRPGMTLWRILVCGVLRVDLNIDYDRLHELVNHHDTLREMLGHGKFDEKCYEYQTLKDNVSLLTPELLDKINQVIVDGGHALVKKNEGETLRGRCDSFVVETHVHYPTDINLLYDAMRKVALDGPPVRRPWHQPLAPACLQCAASEALDALGAKQEAKPSEVARAAGETRSADHQSPCAVSGCCAALFEQSAEHACRGKADGQRERAGCGVPAGDRRLHAPCRASNRPNEAARDPGRTHPARRQSVLDI